MNGNAESVGAATVRWPPSPSRSSFLGESSDPHAARATASENWSVMRASSLTRPVIDHPRLMQHAAFSVGFGANPGCATRSTLAFARYSRYRAGSGDGSARAGVHGRGTPKSLGFQALGSRT